jgi:hypothetical protein
MLYVCRFVCRFLILVEKPTQEKIHRDEINKYSGVIILYYTLCCWWWCIGYNIRETHEDHDSSFSLCRVVVFCS